MSRPAKDATPGQLATASAALFHLGRKLRANGDPRADEVMALHVKAMDRAGVLRFVEANANA